MEGTPGLINQVQAEAVSVSAAADIAELQKDEQLRVAPLVTADIGGSENAAEEIHTDVAPMGIGNRDGRSSGFGHVLMLAPSIRAVIAEGT